MTQTTFTDNVLVDGSQDIEQLRVQGHSTQDDALQTWENSAGDVLAQVTGDGRILVGDDVGLSSPDALIEAHRDEASTTKPKRGFHSLGQVSGTLATLVQWIVGELELHGSSAIDALHTALRIRVTNKNTGTPGSSAELRGADIEVINDASASEDALTKATGLQITVTNATDKTITDAAALRLKVDNDGTITNPYAIHSEGQGITHLEDFIELKQVDSPATPATNFVRVYPKSDGKLYAKNWSGTEYDLTGGDAPPDAQYWVSQADSTLTDEINLGALTSGLLKHTVAAGVSTPATATPGTDYLGPDSSSYEVIQDMIATFLAAGANIAISYNDAGNVLTIAVTGLTVSDISNFSEAVDDRVAGLLVAGTNISLNYVDGSNTLTIGVTGLTASSLSDFAEAVDDRVAALVAAGTGITATYNDGANTLTIAIDSTVATLTGSQTLTNKTLATPTIASFTNATHNHQNSAGGGTLDGASIASGTVAAARLGTMTGATNAAAGASGAVPQSSAGDDIKLLTGAATYVNAVRLLASQYSNVTIANNAAETSLLTGSTIGSWTIPADGLRQGSELEIDVWGFASRNTGNSRFRAKIGSSVVYDSTALAIPWGVSANALWHFKMKLTCQSTGVSGTVIGQAQWTVYTSATTANPSAEYTNVQTTTKTVDTTGSLAVDLTWLWSVANAAQTVTCTNASLRQAA